ncbi:type III pantothenate kinase [Paroceanicella profunda]|uniref:Type III pantothenate kinase n=1 Tax=Paroceanicella profunda TaxID=2579971 RepID=A0A5B8FZX8_9RHOB|nr:type III pantothenate kinase [Paroceanicella profunda]QDL92990.1 type III pantothenate kinase [Paroceanicella profunda]
MLLAIDVGNTNTLFAVHDGQDFVAQWRCATQPQRTADEYFVWLDALMTHSGVTAKAITDVVVSSVVPRVLFNLRVLAQRYFDSRALVVGRDDCELGIPVRVDPGTQVGADRLVNSVGAFRLYGGELIVVDFGTATTFDVVGADGAYEGGVIAPGVNLSLEALHMAAAALPHIDVTRPAQVVGQNTVACMQSGIFWGYVGLVEGICQRIAEERGKRMQVIGTGGLSTLFAQGTKALDIIDTDLTIHGLVHINETNRGRNHA